MTVSDEYTIPESTVEAIWQSVAEMDPDQAKTGMESTAEKQPALLAYLLSYLEESRQEVQHFGVYLYFVVHRAFETYAGRPLSEVTEERLDAHIERTETLYARHEGADERFLERLAMSEMSNQPNVLAYVVEALVEEDEEDVVQLTDEEQGLLFLVLKSIVDALDESLRSEE